MNQTIETPVKRGRGRPRLIPTKETKALKDERIALQNDFQKLKIAELKGRLIDIDELEQFLQSLGLKTSNLLMAKICNELPQRIDRIEPAKRQELCKEVYNEIIVAMKTNIDTWVKTQQEQQKIIHESVITEQT
jgi:hypothetical protein